MVEDTSGLRFATRVIHGGQRPDPLTGAVMPPIYAKKKFWSGQFICNRWLIDRR